MRQVSLLAFLAGALSCAGKGKPPADGLAREGAPAPDAAAPDQDGRVVKISSFRGSKLVLFFYPRDFTAG